MNNYVPVILTGGVTTANNTVASIGTTVADMSNNINNTMKIVSGAVMALLGIGIAIKKFVSDVDAIKTPSKNRIKQAPASIIDKLEVVSTGKVDGYKDKEELDENGRVQFVDVNAPKYDKYFGYTKASKLILTHIAKDRNLDYNVLTPEQMVMVLEAEDFSIENELENDKRKVEGKAQFIIPQHKAKEINFDRIDGKYVNKKEISFKEKFRKFIGRREDSTIINPTQRKLFDCDYLSKVPVKSFTDIAFLRSMIANTGMEKQGDVSKYIKTCTGDGKSIYDVHETVALEEIGNHKTLKGFRKAVNKRMSDGGLSVYAMMSEDDAPTKKKKRKNKNKDGIYKNEKSNKYSRRRLPFDESRAPIRMFYGWHDRLTDEEREIDKKNRKRMEGLRDDIRSGKYLDFSQFRQMEPPRQGKKKKKRW